MATELGDKLRSVRDEMAAAALGAVRLRGSDWFSWATCGGSNAVLLTAEVGVAEVLVTPDEAWVLTDEIEAARLEAEETPPGLSVWAAPWADGSARDAFVRAKVAHDPVASDRPSGEERPLPDPLVARRWSLHADEIERYRVLGRHAAEAVTEVLGLADPAWSGHELAGAAAKALWARGIHPALTLVGDARRLPLYRHPVAASEPLGRRAMLVVCGRRHGLYANLTRFVSFGPPHDSERELQRATLEVEAAAFEVSRPGTMLGQVYDRIVAAYAGVGHPGAERAHHQGGPCGYLARDVIALPGSPLVIQENNALAWNPSLPGAKTEDTIVATDKGMEVLTVDPAWPLVEGTDPPRPDILVRAT